jgi:hypothetical protein
MFDFLTQMPIQQRMRVDVALATYISRATNGGGKIATCRDTVPALRMSAGLRLRDWLKLEAAKVLIVVEPGEAEQAVQARVLYGRWLADCPMCGGAVDVDPAEPVWLCLSCGWPGQLAAVTFPPEREEIERLLVQRPQIHTRNWFPGEPVGHLAEENRQFGHEV